jgi:hypothetical protein
MHDTDDATVTAPDPADQSTWPPDWWRIVMSKEAEKVSSLSWDSILLHHSDKVLHLGPRRSGMHFGHAIGLSYKRR